MIAEALPWTVALLGTTTVGLVRPRDVPGRAARLAAGAAVDAVAHAAAAGRLHAIPFFLLGLILIYLFAFRFPVLPMFGGYSAGAFPALTPAPSSPT